MNNQEDEARREYGFSSFRDKLRGLRSKLSPLAQKAGKFTMETILPNAVDTGRSIAEVIEEYTKEKKQFEEWRKNTQEGIDSINGRMAELRGLGVRFENENVKVVSHGDYIELTHTGLASDGSGRITLAGYIIDLKNKRVVSYTN